MNNPPMVVQIFSKKNVFPFGGLLKGINVGNIKVFEDEQFLLPYIVDDNLELLLLSL